MNPIILTDVSKVKLIQGNRKNINFERSNFDQKIMIKFLKTATERDKSDKPSIDSGLHVPRLFHGAKKYE